MIAQDKSAPLTVAVTTVYALSMPKFIYIQLFGREGADVPDPRRIRADKIEETSAHYVLKLGDQTVGKINSGSVAGWWIQDEGSSSATF